MTALSPLLRCYDQLILDLDGCVWVGDEPSPGSVEAVAALREAGKRVAFATNDSRHAGEEYVAKLWGHRHPGLAGRRGDGRRRDAAPAGRDAHGRTAFVIGTEALRGHVADAGLKVMNGTDLASRAEVVVVGGTDDARYDDLRDAALAVRRGADLLATGRDPTYPMPDGLWPGTGAILAAVETARAHGARSWASRSRSCS